MSIALKCSIEHCDTKKINKLRAGYCQKHYKAKFKYGDPLYHEKLRALKPKSCKVEDCNKRGLLGAENRKEYFPNGYCGMHYRRMWRNGHIKRSRKILGANQKHPLSNTWYGMLARCYDKTHISYHSYGARGIKVCNRWLEFDNFTSDMGNKPPGHTLDRINNDGDYAPENCRWADSTIQATNQRPRKKRTSLPTGVRLEPYGRYRAEFVRYGVSYHVGMFDTAEEASKARQDAIDIVMASKNPS